MRAVLAATLLLLVPTYARAESPEEAAVKAIKAIDGQVDRNRDGVVVKVHLLGPRVKDDDLKPLAGLTGMQELDLGVSGVTDAGLKHLAQLPALKALSLNHTQVTDAGLKHL